MPHLLDKYRMASTNHSLTNFLLFLTNDKHKTYNNDVYYLLLLNHWYFRQDDDTLTKAIFYQLINRTESTSISLGINSKSFLSDFCDT